MGEPGPSDSWKKLVIAKTNDQWVSMSNIKQEQADDVSSAFNSCNLSLDYEQAPYEAVKTESFLGFRNHFLQTSESPTSPESDPLLITTRKEKSESSEERASRLAKMSVYAAQRLANETPEQRASRLKRMSEYAAKRLASETGEQRAKRLARMSAYAAKRLAQETPEQRQARLSRMSAYAAKRHAMKKINGTAVTKRHPPRYFNSNTQACNHYDVATITPLKPNQS